MTSNYPETGPVELEGLLGDNPSTKSLAAGNIASTLVNLRLDALPLIHHGFKPMIREGKYDWGELAIVTFLQAKALGKPLVLLPAVIGARFQHHCIAYNRENGELAPADLTGKTIGVRSYTQTTGVWVRGILQNEYGVDPASVNWVCFEDSHLAEYTDPPNVSRGPQGKKLAQMLLEGELDAAMLGKDMPKDPKVAPVIPNPEDTAKQWYAKHGAVPMNHMIVVRSELSQQRPDVVRELYRMLLESRNRDTPPVDGMQWRPFGIGENRPALELIIDYAHQQKIIDRKLSVDELFDDTTGALGA